MKLGFMLCLILGMFTGCAGQSPQIDDNQAFCQQLADYVSSAYVTLPSSYERYRYDRQTGTLALWGPTSAQDDKTNAHQMVDLSSVSSDYDILFQHQGKGAVISYCLSRYNM